MNRILVVTGASGFLGGALTQRLLEDGFLVRALCRTASPKLVGLRAKFSGALEIKQADLDDVEALKRGCADAYAVFHVAAKAGVWGSYAEFERTNVLGTRNVLSAAKAMNVRYFVYTSTPSVVHGGDSLHAVDERAPYPDRHSAAYPATKARAEREVIAANDSTFATVSLRPHLIWGPGDPHLLPRLIERAQKNRLVLVDGGRATVDATYIDNCVEAHVLALHALERGVANGKCYFIAQNEPLSIADLVRRMLEASGNRFAPRSVSRRTAIVLGTTLETLYRLARAKKEPPITRFVAEQLSTSHHYNLTAAERDLGYRAAISVDDGMRLMAAHFSEKSKDVH